MDKLDHVADSESVRVQNSFGAAVIAGREQFKRTDAVGLDVTPAVSSRHSKVFSGLSLFNRYRDTLFQCVEPNLTMGLDGHRLGPLCDFQVMALARACVSRRGLFSDYDPCRSNLSATP
jgi:hypothetical protein